MLSFTARRAPSLQLEQAKRSEEIRRAKEVAARKLEAANNFDDISAQDEGSWDQQQHHPVLQRSGSRGPFRRGLTSGSATPGSSDCSDYGSALPARGTEYESDAEHRGVKRPHPNREGSLSAGEEEGAGVSQPEKRACRGREPWAVDSEASDDESRASAEANSQSVGSLIPPLGLCSSYPLHFHPHAHFSPRGLLNPACYFCHSHYNPCPSPLLAPVDCQPFVSNPLPPFPLPSPHFPPSMRSTDLLLHRCFFFAPPTCYCLMSFVLSLPPLASSPLSVSDSKLHPCLLPHSFPQAVRRVFHATASYGSLRFKPCRPLFHGQLRKTLSCARLWMDTSAINAFRKARTSRRRQSPTLGVCLPFRYPLLRDTEGNGRLSMQA